MGYEDVSERLRSLPDKEVGQGATDEAIRQAERELGVTFPDGYRAFLRDFGWGGFGFELFGLGPGVPRHLDLIHITLSERTEPFIRIPHHLVPIMNDGGGNHYCLDTASMRGGECPVVFWDHELSEDQVPSKDADAFASWLDERIDIELEELP